MGRGSMACRDCVLHCMWWYSALAGEGLLSDILDGTVTQ